MANTTTRSNFQKRYLQTKQMIESDGTMLHKYLILTQEREDLSIMNIFPPPLLFKILQ